MDDHTRENWKKMKNSMEKSGNTNNMFYKRACEIVSTGIDSIGKNWDKENQLPT